MTPADDLRRVRAVMMNTGLRCVIIGINERGEAAIAGGCHDSQDCNRVTV